MGAKAGPQAPEPKVKLTPKVRAFLDVIRQTVGVTHTEAARLAGYGNPRAHACLIKKKHPQLVADAEAEARKALKMGADEAEQVVVAIARDPTHRDRLKAAETMLKMHGKLSDKLQVTVDRATLNKQLDELIASMAAARAAEQLITAPNNPEQAEPKPESAPN
jgi:hypothetical protein